MQANRKVRSTVSKKFVMSNIGGWSRKTLRKGGSSYHLVPMTTETVENYLKAVYTLSSESPTGEAGVVRLAAMLGVTKGSVTAMVRKLVAAKLVRAERYGGVVLTARGVKVAVDVLRRHRLIETFLVQTLKLDWADVHEDAERLEHALSPRILERLEEFLGHPAADPHGDPIPDASGAFRKQRGMPLSLCRGGAAVRIVRIADQGRAFLTFIAEHGLKPGSRATVVDSSDAADSLVVRGAGKAEVAMSKSAAGKVIVEMVGE